MRIAILTFEGFNELDSFIAEELSKNPLLEAPAGESDSEAPASADFGDEIDSDDAPDGKPTMDARWKAVLEAAATQYGLTTLETMRRFGLTDRMVASASTDGLLRRVAHEVRRRSLVRRSGPPALTPALAAPVASGEPGRAEQE